MRVCFYTLGCKVNLNETGALEQMFRSAGFTIVPEGEEADVFVVNSCTVTNFGDQKSRKWLRRAKRENPGAVTVLTGCYPQAFPEEAAQFMEADLVCGNGDRKAILDNVLKLLDGHERIVAIAPHAKGERFEELPVERFETHTRAFIKVEDGCNRQCAYCVIPRARGPVRSRSEESILAELRQLAASGYREVVLTGIEISSWGQDLPGQEGLIDLLEAVSAAAGTMRVRLGSLEPRTVTEEFCRRASALKNLCPHFHLSLQSGCDATLRRMNRRYDTTRFTESALLLHRFFPNCALTTDLIVGFPGETEEEFSTTLGFIRRCGFAQIHVFPYSVRPGTKAADMEQVPKNIKEERAARAGEVAAALHEEYLQSCVGKTLPVLFEQPGAPGFYTGHAPNYMEVSAPGENLHNCLRPVRITAVEGGILKGEIEP